MDAKHKALAALAGVLFLGCLFIAWSWLESHDAEMKLGTRIEIERGIQNDADKKIAALSEEMTQRDAEKARQLTELSARFQSANNPQQIAALVSQIVGLQKPVQFVTPPATPDNPHPAPVAQIPAEDVGQVKLYVQGCENCKVELDAAKKDILALRAQIEQLKIEKASLAATLAEAEKAAKGGGFWTRTRHILEAGAIGGAVGFAGGYTTCAKTR